MPHRKLAALDVGTNSIRCIVAEADGEGHYRILDDEKAPVRLGEGMSESGRIGAAAWGRAREALARMRMILEGFGVSHIEAVATSAVRKAANGVEFLAAMKREAGIDIRLIDGEEEAELSTLSAHRNFAMEGVRHAIIDIGGGSTEVIVATGPMLEGIHSFETGAVKLTEKFTGYERPAPKSLTKLRKYVLKKARKAYRNWSPKITTCIGSGGTVTAIGALVMAQRGDKYTSTHGYEVLHSEVVHALAMLQRMTRKERRALRGLSPERADIIVAGVASVEAMMSFLGANVLKINARGLREGIILRRFEELGLAARAPGDWRASATTLAKNCQVDLAHSEHVTTLALSLFDAVKEEFNLSDRSRELLEAAGILHDIGYFLAFEKHHKRSYYLIKHAHINGLTPREQEIVANLARYHRGALPKAQHENMGPLSSVDRDLVMKLGGLLKLADGLDRRRGAQVNNVDTKLTRKKLTLTLKGEGDLSVEAHGGMAKADLFERAFGRIVRFKHNG